MNIVLMLGIKNANIICNNNGFFGILGKEAKNSNKWEIIEELLIFLARNK